MIDPLIEMMCEYEALDRWRNGIEPAFSEGVCGSLTCGYGKLDNYGYWQYPLYPAEKYSKLLTEKHKSKE